MKSIFKGGGLSCDIEYTIIYSPVFYHTITHNLRKYGEVSFRIIKLT